MLSVRKNMDIEFVCVFYLTQIFAFGVWAIYSELCCFKLDFDTKTNFAKRIVHGIS